MINKIQTSNVSFAKAKAKAEKKPKNEDKRILSNINKYVRNSADMNDTITVPRTIFKGYLGVMAGTTLATLGGLAKSPKNTFGKILKIAGGLVSLYGTFAFVRPFLIKDKKEEAKPEGKKEVEKAPKEPEKVYKLVEVDKEADKNKEA